MQTRVPRTAARRPRPSAPRSWPILEILEDRVVPAGTSIFHQTNLDSDLPGMGVIPPDPDLVNPWGIALSGGSPFWISDNQTGLATLYSDAAGNGDGKFTKLGLRVTIPDGFPTGQIANTTASDFRIDPKNPTSAKSAFIFDSESGDILAWAGGNVATVEYTDPVGSVYKGLTFGSVTTNGTTANYIYAANFRSGNVDVFDTHFKLTQLAGSFSDPSLPSGFAPFNVQNLGGKIYVTFAQQDEFKHDEVDGPGLGYVDVFTTSGILLQRLARGGTLNAPWGLELAPAGFGKFGGDVLVGNFGDGTVNAFDPNTNTFKGQLRDETGQVISIDGLWGLSFGNGAAGGDKTTLYFTAGLNGENDGLLGKLTPVNVNIIATTDNLNGRPEITVFGAATHQIKATIQPFDPSFHGDVHVAVGDVNGDGIPDIIAATGAGGHTVRVFDGLTDQPMPGLLGNLPVFFGNAGLNVAAGDINGDGHADIIVAPDSGFAPLILTYSGATGLPLSLIFSGSFTNLGGVRLASADVNGDGFDDIIAADGGNGPHSSPTVRVFSGKTGALLFTLPGGDGNFHGALYVAASDVNNDGMADIILSQGPGGDGMVRIFSGAGTHAALGSFQAAARTSPDGVRVAALDATGNGKILILTVAGKGSTTVTLWDPTTLLSVGTFQGADAAFTGGLGLAGGLY
jgi:uncharacterized protein (TIGR03118 family)